MAKIVGFNGKAAEKARVRRGLANKFKSVADWLKDPLFLGACQKTAEKLEMDLAGFEALKTKRQVSKFLNGKGLVYTTTIKGDTDGKTE
jgi:hypothetical protein